MNNENTAPAKKPTSVLHCVIAGLIILLFTSNLIFSLLPLAAVTLMVFIYGAYRLCKNKKLLAIILLIVGGVLFVASPETIDSTVSLTAIYISLIGATAVGGALLCNGKRGVIIYVIFSVLAYTIAYIFTKSPIDALEVLSTLPCAVTFAVCKKKKASRVSALCAASLVFLASLYLPAIIATVSQYGADALKQISEAVSATRDSLIDEMIAASKELGGEGDSFYSPQVITAIITLTFNLLPALFITVSNAIVFFTQTCFFSISESLGGETSDEERAFELSKTSAWMFFISFGAMFILGFFKGVTAEILSLSMMNLNLILVPAFLVSAVIAFTKTVKQRNIKMSPFTAIIAVLVAINFGPILIYPIAAFGAVGTIKRAKKAESESRTDGNTEGK